MFPGIVLHNLENSQCYFVKIINSICAALAYDCGKQLKTLIISKVVK
jgi:hypothetical protein